MHLKQINQNCYQVCLYETRSISTQQIFNASRQNELLPRNGWGRHYYKVIFSWAGLAMPTWTCIGGASLCLYRRERVGHSSDRQFIKWNSSNRRFIVFTTEKNLKAVDSGARVTFGAVRFNTTSQKCVEN